MSEALTELAIGEVRALHALFVDWFRPGDGGDFAGVEGALAPDFRRIAPDGSIADRDATLAMLRGARGTAPADFAIAILAPRPVWRAEAAVLLEFVEQQYRGGETSERRSTALLTPEPSAPRGIAWRHMHETYMAGNG